MNTNSKVTISDWLLSSTAKLKETGSQTARLDSLILIENVMAMEKAQILAHQDIVLKKPQRELLDNYLNRRIKHEPIAYILGKSEFYGRIFAVNKHVLVPRPETETIIDELKKIPEAYNGKIADIGCGSGILGITAALELKNSNVDLYDIDSAALNVAKYNMSQHKLSLGLFRSDLISGLNKAYSLILANLPYVPENYSISSDVVYEPSIAIFGGLDGMALYQELWKGIAKLKYKKPKLVITESFPHQHNTQKALAKEVGFTEVIVNDYIQVFSSDSSR